MWQTYELYHFIPLFKLRNDEMADPLPPGCTLEKCMCPKRNAFDMFYRVAHKITTTASTATKLHMLFVDMMGVQYHQERSKNLADDQS